MAFGVSKNCSFQPSTSQNWKNFAKHFFDIVTTYNDEICYVKHVLAPYLGVGGGGGAPKGSRAQPAYAVFPPQQLKNGNFGT